MTTKINVTFPSWAKFLFKPKRYKVALGGRGCVTSDTMLDTPSGKIAISDFSGGYVYSYEDGKIVLAYASKPMAFAEEDIYEVETECGKKIKCTDEHVFLAETGWLMTKTLRAGQRVCVSELPKSYASHHQTIRDSDPLTSLEDAQNLTRKLLNYLANYLLCLHQCDLQPQLARDTYLASLPLQDDAQLHNFRELFRVGDSASAYKHNPSLILSHLSSLSALQAMAEKNYAYLESYNAYKSFELLSEFYLQFQQSQHCIAQTRKALQLLEQSPVHDISTHLAQTLETALCKLEHAFSCNPFVKPLSVETSTTLTEITSIRKLSRQVYWDIHVASTNCYFAEGILNHNSGKSYTFADALLIQGYGKKIKVLCGREFQNSIADSVHSLLASRIDALGLRGQYEILRDTIIGKNGTEFIFKGLRHNIESIKSIYGITHLWIEEAATVSGESWEVLKPTIREPGSEIWITFNPGSSQDAMSKRFIAPYESDLMEHRRFEDDTQTIAVVNYLDNPHFPDALEQERRWAYDNLPRALYDHIWLGKYNDSVENAIIPAEWFDACVDAHVKLNFKPRGAKVYSHDPADTGKDPKGYALRYGSVILDAGEIEQPDINTALDAACEMAIRHQVDLFTWDCDGMGVGLKREVDTWFAGKQVQIRQFRGSNGCEHPDSIYEPVDNQQKQKRNKEVFKNKRAQNYWLLRDRCYRTYRAVVHGEYSDPDNLISFSSSIKLLQKLRSELCRIPKKYNPSGLIQIMSKEDMRKLGIASPNIADSVMMAMDGPETAVEFNDIEFKSLW